MERVRPSIRAASSERSLKFVDTLRALGVVFDRRLSFFAHADHLKEKVNHLAAKVVTFKNMVAGNEVYWGGLTGPAIAPESDQWPRQYSASGVALSGFIWRHRAGKRGGPPRSTRR
ncbi:hypothetical protein MRX96_051869 [Rhipicephalus microplus]